MPAGLSKLKDTKSNFLRCLSKRMRSPAASSDSASAPEPEDTEEVKRHCVQGLLPLKLESAQSRGKGNKDNADEQ